jgi:hypothetical protein
MGGMGGLNPVIYLIFGRKQRRAKPMRKNYLVIIPDYNDLSIEEVGKVFDADWYEADGIILVDAVEVNYLSEDDPIDVGIDLSATEIVAIADCLKRGNEIDGFYHA